MQNRKRFMVCFSMAITMIVFFVLQITNVITKQDLILLLAFPTIGISFTFDIIPENKRKKL